MRLHGLVKESNTTGIEDSSKSISYAELGYKTTQLAKIFGYKLGVGPIIGNGIDWHLSALAQLKAGRIVVSGKLKDEIPSYNDGAWIVFTSGSTDTPKPVVFSHRALIQLAKDEVAIKRLLPCDRIAHLRYQLGGVRATLSAFAASATLVCYNKETDGDLAQWVNRKKITVLELDGTMYRHLMVAGVSFPTVRIVDIGGEQILSGDFDLYKERFRDDCLFINRLALTETSVVAELFLHKRNHVREGRLPVGLPRRNVYTRMEDGELLVSSPYLAIEY